MPAQPDVQSIHRERLMSPHEEFLERCRHVAPPIRLPDHVRATLLQHTRYETVEKDGSIRFELLGVKYEYFSRHCFTCQNERGKRVLVTFSYDALDAIYVLGEDKRFIEAIPAKGKPKWFDNEAVSREIHDQEVQLAQARAELEALHAGETQKRLETGRQNLQRIEVASKAHIVNTFSARHAPTTPVEPARLGEAGEAQTDADNESRQLTGSRDLLARSAESFPHAASDRGLKSADHVADAPAMHRTPIGATTPARPSFDLTAKIEEARTRLSAGEQRRADNSRREWREQAGANARLSEIAPSSTPQPRRAAAGARGILLLTKQERQPGHKLKEEGEHDDSHGGGEATD